MVTGMYTGLSFSRCVLDIALGFVKLEEVDKIICGTRCSTPEDWDVVITKYRNRHWWRKPDEAEQIAREFLNSNRLEQPGLVNPQHSPDVTDGHWIKDGKIIQLSYL